MSEKRYLDTECMTEITAKQWDYVTQNNLTAKEAVEYLKHNMRIRTFPEIVREIYGEGLCEEILFQGLYQISLLEEGEKVQQTSIRRKIKNWVNQQNMPTDREEVFRICFALGLDLEQSEKMLCRLTEQGIHYRNRREVIYAYCLKYHMGFENALLLQRQFGDKGAESGKKDEAKGTPVTHIMKSEFRKLQAKEDLFTFIMKYRTDMGDIHNTAYSYFCKMMDILSGEELEGEEKYSMENITEYYLRFNMPLDKKTSSYSNVQKVIKKYWPGIRSIKAMKSRREDVTRKVLLLLYIATGGIWDEKYDEIDETYTDSSQFLEFHCKCMNRMLKECGMNRIDPRNIFDYLIIYCLRPEDDMFMGDRLASMITKIFEVS